MLNELESKDILEMITKEKFAKRLGWSKIKGS